MNFFLFFCDKNQEQDEKTAMNLLDIKNLEKSLKNSERKNLKKENDIDLNNVLKDNINTSDEELEIIEYPYSNNEINNIKNIFKKDKIIINRKISHLVNLPKTNIINRSNNLFYYNKLNLKNSKLDSKADITSSSQNNESLIIDDIEYLNDEDVIQVPKKKIKLKENNTPKNNLKKINILKYVNKRNNVNNNYNTFNNMYNLSHVSANKKVNSNSFKSTKVSALNNKKNNKNNKNKQIYSFSQKKEDNKFLRKISNNNKFNFNDKNNKKFDNQNLSKTNITNTNIKKKNLNNEEFSKIDIYIKKNNKMNNLFNYKRINKRRINIKKINLDLNISKNQTCK